MSKVFFISDTHFNHSNIIKYCHRPFLCAADRAELDRLGGRWNNGSWKGRDSSPHRIADESVYMMNDEIINNINAVVGERDVLWHLGDFAFAPKQDYYYRCRKYRDRINCRNVNIVWGNHDEPHVIRDLFNEAHFLTDINVNGQKIVLCHYALAVWDKSHRGSWNLYGHSHAGAEPWMDANMPGRRSFDVGVDNAYKILGKYGPWAFEDVSRIMERRDGFSMDHHIPKNDKGPSEEERMFGLNG